MNTWEKQFNLSKKSFDELRFEVTEEIQLVNRFYQAKHVGIGLKPGNLLKIREDWSMMPSFTSSHRVSDSSFPAGYFPNKEAFICMYIEEIFGFWYSEATFKKEGQKAIEPETEKELLVQPVGHDYIVRCLNPQVGYICFCLGKGTVSIDDVTPKDMYEKALIDFEQRFTIVLE